MQKKHLFLFIFSGLFLLACRQADQRLTLEPTTDNGAYFFLKSADLKKEGQHQSHFEIFGKYVQGYNDYILQGIDQAQSSAMDGGGYFTGITAQPTESPIGYELQLLGRPLLDPPRTTSYCSGASYTAFIEGLNRILRDMDHPPLDYDHYEAMRMQEPDGGRREDLIKFWGYWNADGFGSHFALVQYAGMGREIKPENARPGDFMNISWKSGLGHSVVFLGWYRDAEGQNNVVYWSSQKSTNGMSDQVVPLDKVKYVKIVRLTRPERLFDFDINTPVNTDVPPDSVDFAG